MGVFSSVPVSFFRIDSPFYCSLFKKFSTRLEFRIWAEDTLLPSLYQVVEDSRARSSRALICGGLYCEQSAKIPYWFEAANWAEGQGGEAARRLDGIASLTLSVPESQMSQPPFAG